MKNWDFKLLRKLFMFCEIVNYKHGNLVYKEGDPADEIFIVRTGEF